MTPADEERPKEGEKKVKAKRKVTKKVTTKAKAEGTTTTVKAKPSRRREGTRDIGIDVKAPDRTCTDRNCPFHGTLPVRGQIMEGEVVTDRATNSAVVRRVRLRYISKYERYEKVSSRYTVHNPPCIDAKRGDKVKIMECRPLSKTKSFVIVEKKEAV